ncbi:MAG: enoyl-CoA hydratase/isomerase [Caulobacteraceae bacterium]|nr:enoyl-CoA hydratase/isomerase [Caulobacteraceae bacterium]
MAYSKIRVERDGAIATITLADPATLNAAGVDMAQELTQAFGEVAEGGARAVILTGEGRGFCSGANLTAGGGPGQREAPSPDGPDAGSALETVYNPFVTMLRDYKLPIVTAVNGAAAGVGCSLALMGDIIVAGESAYFLQAFRRIGLIPDGGSTYLLPRMIGRARAMEMTLMGDKVPAATALDWGLVNRCVPDDQLMATARDFADKLASGPASVTMIRQIMWRSLDAHWADQLWDERTIQRDASRTRDFGEGVRAFIEKRPAQFQGR